MLQARTYDDARLTSVVDNAAPGAWSVYDLGALETVASGMSYDAAFSYAMIYSQVRRQPCQLQRDNSILD